MSTRPLYKRYMTENTSSFGYWIRRQRKALDLTQQVLADRVGCSLAAIKKIEADERRPSRQIAERIADVLAVPASQREIFLEVARGLRPVDHLSVPHEPVSTLPSGTVTFLYTDIEGSTKLAQQHPGEWEIVRSRHLAILREAIERHKGYVFQAAGDGVCAAFRIPGNGLRAAIDAQLELQTENWGNVPIKVRMGIHTGQAEIRANGEYHGYLTMSHAQRLMSAGHGGQVLLSSAAQRLVQEELPEDVGFLDLGGHKLKDFERAEHIFQVLAADLPQDFPPLNARAVFPNNLPVQLNSFVGRQRELTEIRQLLASTHLLTLTGPGGTGKTRLSLQLGLEVLEHYPDGVWLVELAPVGDPTLVPPTVALTLGVRQQPGRSILDALTDYLRAKSILLLLDNCEHLIETCAQLVEGLLRAAPRLNILATSREALGITGEIAYRLPSLPLPDPRQSSDLESLSQNDCVHLFVDRAVAASPSFHLREKNAPVIAEICRRLDGIPLAIELAAARTKVFPAEEIASRLDDRFRLLTGGSRTALERHQTLFALIDWSHNLLFEGERVLLRRLAVFAGGWSFEAAQTVCGEGIKEGILDLLTRLVDKSLVAVDEVKEAARYRLPETIRQFARDRLFESGEAEQIRDRHLDFFIAFAEEAEPKLRSAEQIEWLEREETEQDNLRAALAWALERGNSNLALQLAGALHYFCLLRGNFSELDKWVSDALAVAEQEQRTRAAAGEKYVPSPTESRQRARALYGAAISHFGDMDAKKARVLIEESLSLWRQLGDKWWMAMTLQYVALLEGMDGDVRKALAREEEGVSLAREVDDPWLLASCLIRWGDDLKLQGTEMTKARQSLEEGVTLARDVGDKSILSQGLRELGSLTYASGGNLTRAASLVEEALAEAHAIGDLFSMALALVELTGISCLQNDPAKAKGYCLGAWVIKKETGSAFVALFTLVAFGLAESFGSEPGKGTHLLAAAEVLLQRRGMHFSSMEGSPIVKVYNRAIEKVQAQLGAPAFQAAWAEGQRLTLEQALALAMEGEAEE